MRSKPMRWRSTAENHWELFTVRSAQSFIAVDVESYGVHLLGHSRSEQERTDQGDPLSVTAGEAEGFTHMHSKEVPHVSDSETEGV